jgi:hypothetical protein
MRAPRTLLNDIKTDANAQAKRNKHSNSTKRHMTKHK